MFMNVFGIKYNGVEKLINKIPNGQLCQAYDPIMIFEEKTKNILEDPMKANTSCFAPAFIYMEGSRGKRFLCDYHYGFESIITQHRTPHLWQDIEKYLVDEREKIKETFDYTNSTNIATGQICWCGAPTFVLIIDKENKGSIYYCNFHYRKTYYRYLSNNKKLEDFYDIVDERHKMTISIKQETDIIKDNFTV